MDSTISNFLPARASEQGNVVGSVRIYIYYIYIYIYIYMCVQKKIVIERTRDLNKMLGRARDPHANGAWLNKLTE